MSALEEHHVSLVALLVVILVMSIPEWVAFVVWWRVQRSINYEFQRLAQDRAAGQSAALRRAYGTQAEEASEHGDDGEGFQDLSPDRTRVEELRDWSTWSQVPPVWQDPPEEGKS